MDDVPPASTEQVPEEQARFWFRLSCGMLALTLIGVALTVRGLLIAFDEIAMVEGPVGPSVLAPRISRALKWMTLGMVFFWPGVIVAIIGFWKKYVTPRAALRDMQGARDNAGPGAPADD
jgi:hypothetical protein